MKGKYNDIPFSQVLDVPDVRSEYTHPWSQSATICFTWAYFSTLMMMQTTREWRLQPLNWEE